jgi:hypothetical protein
MELPKISIEEESLTPVSLAKKLKENPAILLKELKDEKGIFEDTMQENTILAWDTIQRACERRGYEVVDNYEIHSEKNFDKSSSLNASEKEALKHCISFHKMYADLIEEGIPKSTPGSPVSSKLSQYHSNISKAIEGVLEKIERKEKASKLNIEELSI